jgi:HSP20 family protein
MHKIQQQLNRILTASESPGEFPAVDVWVSETGAIMRAELPGIEAEDVDVSLNNDALTIKGSRKPHEAKDGETCHRQERSFGQFARTLSLPFAVEADMVEAKFTNGILKITLPRAEAEKPRKISISA